jgi:hypothetical protein
MTPLTVNARRTLSAGLLGLAVLLGLGTPGRVEADGRSDRPGDQGHLGRNVVAFAQRHLNRKVGNGECWTLAFEALKFAGAHLPGQNGYGTYVFGRQVGLGQLQSGDILQFEGVRFDHHGPKGAHNWTSFPHHTAIVESVRGKSVTILQQNFNDVRRVGRATINMGDRTAGTIAAYRPQPR